MIISGDDDVGDGITSTTTIFEHHSLFYDFLRKGGDNSISKSTISSNAFFFFFFFSMRQSCAAPYGAQEYIDSASFVCIVCIALACLCLLFSCVWASLLPALSPACLFLFFHNIPKTTSERVTANCQVIQCTVCTGFLLGLPPVWLLSLLLLMLLFFASLPPLQLT